MTTTVVKIKPVQKSSVQKTLSLEEYIDLQSHNVELTHQIDSSILNAVRTIEVAEALEELAVVADSISNATQAETNLIEIGGNIAVAGTHLDASEIIPSMEGYVGTKISIEDFDLKGKLKKIWEVIKKVWSAIWERIEEFFKNSNVLVGISLNRIRKLEKEVKDNAGKVAKPERMELDVNQRKGMVNVTENWTLKSPTSVAFKSILNDGKSVITDPVKIDSLLNSTNNLYTTFFESYVKRLEKIGNDLVVKINSINENNIQTVGNDITTMLRNEIPGLFNTVKSSLLMQSSNKPTNITGKNNSQNGIQTKEFFSNILGGPSFILSLPDNSQLNTDKEFIDRARVSKIKLEMIAADSLNDARDLDTPYTQKEMEAIVGKTYDLLKEVKYFKDHGLENKIKDTRKKVEEATKSLTDKFTNLSTEDVEMINSIMSLNIAFVNWTRYPLMDLVSYSLKIERTISWLIRQNLEFYVKGKKADTNNQKKP